MTTSEPITASARITAEVTSWPGVTAGPGPRGELGFRAGRREIGHLHGDRVAHFGFPRAVWRELMDAGRIVRHPIDHDGWGARPIHGPEDEAEVIALMRLNYDRAVAAGR
ncbi:MAG: luciferase family protein [Thermoleophilia bacterium]